MEARHVAFVTGCVLVFGCCAESAWIGFRDGLRGMSPLPEADRAAVVADVADHELEPSGEVGSADSIVRAE